MSAVVAVALDTFTSLGQDELFNWFIFIQFCFKVICFGIFDCVF